MRTAGSEIIFFLSSFFFFFEILQGFWTHSEIRIILMFLFCWPFAAQWLLYTTPPLSLKYFKVFKVQIFPTPCIYGLLVTLIINRLFFVTVPSDFLIMTEINLVKRVFFDVLLTVHLSIFILVINQLDARNLFYSKFISCLYMFRAPCAHRQEVKIVLYSLWYDHTYRCGDTRHL